MGAFQDAIDALTTGPDVSFKFDDATDSWTSEGTPTITMSPVGTTQSLTEAPGIIRDGDEFALWVTPLTTGQNSYFTTSNLTDFDATGWSTGTIAFAHVLCTDEFGNNHQIFEWQYGGSGVWMRIFIDTNERLNLHMLNGLDVLHVRTTAALDSAGTGTHQWISITQRGDSNDIVFRVNGADVASEDVTRAGTGAGVNAWVADVFPSTACSEFNMFNQNANAALSGLNEFSILQRPCFWRSDISNADIDSLHTACNFNGDPTNLLQLARDYSSDNLWYFVMPQVHDDTNIDNKSIFQYLDGYQQTISAYSGVLRSSTAMGTTTFADDEDINGGANYNYPEMRIGTGTAPKLQGNAPGNVVDTATVGTVTFVFDFNDGAPASDKSCWGTSGNASTNWMKCGLNASGDVFFELHNGTNFYRATCDTPLSAGHHDVTVVQDGVQLKIYIDGVDQAITETGTLAATVWLNDMPISTNNRGVAYGGGVIFADDMDLHDFGVFVWSPNAWTAEQVSQWHDAVANGTFATSPFSSKTIRRTGRRLFSSDLP